MDFKDKKILCINCIPATGSFLFLQDWLRETKVRESIGEELKVSYYGLAEFGKGYTMLAASVDKLLRDGYFPEYPLVLSTLTKEGQVLLDVLMDHFPVVFKNF